MKNLEQMLDVRDREEQEKDENALHYFRDAVEANIFEAVQDRRRFTSVKLSDFDTFYASFTKVGRVFEKPNLLEKIMDEVRKAGYRVTLNEYTETTGFLWWRKNTIHKFLVISW